MMLTGRVAQFGQGIAQDVAKTMLDQFAACLEQEISGGKAAGDASEFASKNAAADAGVATGGITSGDEPAGAVGATVEGAIVAGSSPSEAAAGAPTTSRQQPTIQEMPRREPPEEPETSDLDAPGRDEIPKRLSPMLAIVGALLIFLWLFRRRR